MLWYRSVLAVRSDRILASRSQSFQKRSPEGPFLVLRFLTGKKQRAFLRFLTRKKTERAGPGDETETKARPRPRPETASRKARFEEK